MVNTRKILGLMLMAMLFVTVALLYVTGPKYVTSYGPDRPCGTYEPHTLGSNICNTEHTHRSAAWERVYYSVVGA